MSDIIRDRYPQKRREKDHNRYPESAFDEYEARTTPRDKYEKWKRGVNFLTGQTIPIGSKAHKELGVHFTVRRYEDQHHCLIPCTKLDGIDRAAYVEETRRLDVKHERARAYNTIIDEVIKRINNLDSYDQFVEFEGKKYGLPPILNEVHRKNNCMGKMIKISEPCGCHECEDWNANHDNIRYEKCDKCGYATTIYRFC